MRALAATSVGIAIAIGITLALNYTMFGKLTFNTYPTEKFNWNDGMMLHVLTAERHGVFRIYPILGVAVIAGLLTRRSRLMTGGFLLVVAAYTVLYGHWWAWQLASGFGHRGFVEVVPFAIPVFAVALAALRAGSRPRSSWSGARPWLTHWCRCGNTGTIASTFHCPNFCRP